MVKTLNTRRTTNTILININIILPKAADMCGSKVTTSGQSFMEIALYREVKIFQKFGGAALLTRLVHISVVKN